ncbi:MAG: D-alanyl-D-alanine carboxypeptidase, partial [Gemmatimonadota bacterium]|nr:D-alanyl-D-alanine carboxypeptidase [Gemmatimonadota bacterium]
MSHFPEIPLPKIPNSQALLQLAGAKAVFPSLIAVLALSLWTTGVRNDEPVPPLPLVVAETTVRSVPTPPPSRDVLRLREDLSALLDTPALRSAEWSVLVVSLDEKDTLFARDENRFLAPASNMKIATTAAALHFLGPEFRYQTFVFADGPIENGV